MRRLDTLYWIAAPHKQFSVCAGRDERACPTTDTRRYIGTAKQLSIRASSRTSAESSSIIIRRAKAGHGALA